MSEYIKGDYGVISIKQPTQVEWAPQEDITAYELALLMPLFHMHHIMPEDLPEGPERRHIIVRN